MLKLPFRLSTTCSRRRSICFYVYQPWLFTVGSRKTAVACCCVLWVGVDYRLQVDEEVWNVSWGTCWPIKRRSKTTQNEVTSVTSMKPFHSMLSHKNRNVCFRRKRWWGNFPKRLLRKRSEIVSIYTGHTWYDTGIRVNISYICIMYNITYIMYLTKTFPQQHHKVSPVYSYSSCKYMLSFSQWKKREWKPLISIPSLLVAIWYSVFRPVGWL